MSTSKLEGINNRIKVTERNAYSFRYVRYERSFKLKLYAQHVCCTARNIGQPGTK
ncbi:hypothetical protein [Leyella lascolaii]|uniref:hypothetical protein n=1 Tax=Leyella lascolaii TaxID=1776379 RepID=UPI002356E625|nr:hypothetical protein [Leyella lascolaii]